MKTFLLSSENGHNVNKKYEYKLQARTQRIINSLFVHSPIQQKAQQNIEGMGLIAGPFSEREHSQPAC